MNRRCYGLMVLLIIATAGDSIELAPSARKTKEKATVEDFPPEIVDFSLRLHRLLKRIVD